VKDDSSEEDASFISPRKYQALQLQLSKVKAQNFSLQQLNQRLQERLLDNLGKFRYRYLLRGFVCLFPRAEKQTRRDRAGCDITLFFSDFVLFLFM